MEIRTAKMEDIDEIMKVFEIAKNFMHNNGNPTQWSGGYPSKEIIFNDIQNENFYIVENENKICGVFAFILGEDTTYKTINDGSWLNNEDYGTIHRIASDFSQKGIFKKVFEFCLTKTKNIRCDTHKDNLPMQNAMLKNGFKKCGIIYILSGDERIAFHYVKE